MKTCKHFRYQIPEDEANALRILDEEHCIVCDIRPRHIFCENRGQYVFIPKLFNTEKQR